MLTVIQLEHVCEEIINLNSHVICCCKIDCVSSRDRLGGTVFSSLMCSGRGECDCVCDCTVPGTYGDACHCDDFSDLCKSGENEVCSGKHLSAEC